MYISLLMPTSLSLPHPLLSLFGNPYHSRLPMRFLVNLLIPTTVVRSKQSPLTLLGLEVFNLLQLSPLTTMALTVLPCTQPKKYWLLPAMTTLGKCGPTQGTGRLLHSSVLLRKIMLILLIIVSAPTNLHVCSSLWDWNKCLPRYNWY